MTGDLDSETYASVHRMDTLDRSFDMMGKQFDKEREHQANEAAKKRKEAQEQREHDLEMQKILLEKA